MTPVSGLDQELNFQAQNLRPYYPSMRFKVDLSQQLGRKHVQQLAFWFIKGENYSIEIKLDDKLSDTNRPLYMNKIRQNGYQLILECLKSIIKRTSM